MKFTANFYVRVLGALVLGYVGWYFGSTNSLNPPTTDQQIGTMLLVLSGLGLGLVLTPYLILYPFRAAMRRARTMPSLDLVATSIGLLLGLIVGVLLSFPVSHLPGLLGAYLPFVSALVCAYVSAVVINWRKNDLLDLIYSRQEQPVSSTTARRFLVDTSVIIDGRIADVVKTGFFNGRLVIPRFVLQELQQLADSPDDLTRLKGKRGLDILRTIQEGGIITIEISDADVPGMRDVDDKLVVLAKAENMWLITNDSNLHRIAELQRVEVLNLNNLADTLRVPFLPGEHMHVTIRQEGREREQGVGFMQDGTMVVVEEARHLLGSEVPVVVTRVYQTNTGRIIFAQLVGNNGRSHS
ncbi:MAG TPA: hypothetical protein VGD58_20740 [Herpetosiphonaceae bacterium]